ncbi:MAG: HEAT repeat domain-containing protein, partial [Pirellulaceae bacterium]|nr:HEAT repeat domain-containing protein [Pirellulaceae bacterium]
MSAPAQEPSAEDEAVIGRIEALKRRDPIVEVLDTSKPATPADAIQLATIMADLGRADLAKKHLQTVLDANLDRAGLVDLAARFDSRYFARLASRPELAPEARRLADAVLSAVQEQTRSAEHVGQMIEWLSSDNQRIRDEGIIGLRKAGSAAVVPLMGVLVDPARQAEHDPVRAMLVALGGAAVEPLLAYLESGDPVLMVEAIGVLGRIGSRETSIRLLAPYWSADGDPRVREAADAALRRILGAAPTAKESARILTDRARHYFDAPADLGGDEAGRTVVWLWEPEQRHVATKTLLADAARARLAARLAGEALAIAPSDADTRHVYLLTTLEAAGYEAGFDEPIELTPDTPLGRVAEFGPKALLTALDEALRSDHGPAAAAAAQILGQTATADEALAVGASPSPLARALRSSDRRTRAAAVDAVVRLKPTKPFAGSSYLPEAMAFLASSTGQRRAMVAARNTADALAVGGHLAGLGFEVETAVTGREMIQKLVESADFELVFLDARIDLPPLGILVQQLRQDGRTAAMPAGILAAEGFADRAERAARNDPMTLVLARPSDRETAKWQVERLASLARRAHVSPELRKQMAARTLGQLAELAETSRGVFDLSRVERAALGAAWSPALSGDAVAVLERLGSPESQKALVDLASNRGRSLEIRNAALAALAASIERNGILLTTGQILQQYDRYNGSAAADKPTQQILGGILD